jgi:hypothetical protein
LSFPQKLPIDLLQSTVQERTVDFPLKLPIWRFRDRRGYETSRNRKEQSNSWNRGHFARSGSSQSMTIPNPFATMQLR